MLDFEVFKAINGFSVAHDGFEDPLTFYSRISELLFATLLVALFVAAPGGIRSSARRTAIAAGLSAALALGAAQVIAHLVDRGRPYVDHPGSVHLFTARASDPSFPSDHATAAFAIGMAIWLRNRGLGAVVLVMAALLGLGRVAVGAHYPGDVIAGALLGVAAAVLLWMPPLRSRVDRLADRCSDAWQRAGAALRRLAEPGPRA